MFFGSLLLGQMPHLPSPQLRTKCSLGPQLNVHSEHHMGSKSKAAVLSGFKIMTWKKSCYIFFLRNIQAEASEPLPGAIAPSQRWGTLCNLP